jgi:serpin B
LIRSEKNHVCVNPAFTGDADFSVMTGDKDLFVGKIKHKAFIEVNEQGSEAAGATSVHMVLKSAPATMFNADHPFIYLIQHKETNTILFMGKLVNPQ